MKMRTDVAVRDANVPLPGGQTFGQALHALNLDCFEMQFDFDRSLPHLKSEGGAAPALKSVADAQALRQRLQDEGVQVAALLLATDFSGPQASEHITWAVEAVRAAHELGAGAVRLDPYTSNRTLPMPDIRDNFVRCAGEVLRQTEGSGVDLGIENHGLVGNNPEFLNGIFERAGDERLGMTLDTGNFYWSGLPLSELYSLFEQLAPRAKHTHIKSIAYPAELREVRREPGYEYGRFCAPIDEGDIDMQRVVSILRAAAYTRPLCIENEALSKYEAATRPDVLRREVALLRATLAGS